MRGILRSKGREVSAVDFLESELLKTNFGVQVGFGPEGSWTGMGSEDEGWVWWGDCEGSKGFVLVDGGGHGDSCLENVVGNSATKMGGE